MPTPKPLDQWTGQDAADYLAGLVARDLGSDDLVPRSVLGGSVTVSGRSPHGEMARRHALVTGAGSRYDMLYRLCELKDHWQNGALWVGPRGTPDVQQAVLARVAPLFVPDDAVGEGLENVGNGLLEREPTLEVVTLAEQAPAPAGVTDGNPVPPSARETSEAERTPEDAAPVLREISRWWDRVDFDEVLRRAVRRAQWAGRGVLRLRVPASKLVNGRLPQGIPPAEAFDAIEVDAPLPADAGLAETAGTEQPVAIVRAVGADDSQGARYEVWSLEGTGPERQTVLRVVGDAGVSAPIGYPMRGRLPVAEMRTEPLISGPIVRQQCLLNFITSVLGRTVETSGFAERYTTNAEKEGLWTDQKPDTPPLKEMVWQGKTYYLKAVPRTLGAGIAVDLVGLETTDPKTNVKSWETPSVIFKEPTDTSYVTNAATAVRLRLFQQMKQRHLAGTVTAEASGEAYEQARAQFESHLHHVRHPAEGMTRDLLESLLALVGLMAPEVGRVLDRYRLQATLHIDTGPLTAAEQQNIIALRDARLIGQATAMARARVEDVEAEMDAILADPAVMADVSLKQAQTYAAWIPQTTEAVAAWLTGLTPEQATALATARLPTEVIQAGYPDVTPTPAPEEPAPVADPANPTDPSAPPAPGAAPPTGAPGARPSLSAA